jgi:hypothetical protein
MEKIVLAQDNYERYDVNMEYFILKDNGEHGVLYFEILTRKYYEV